MRNRMLLKMLGTVTLLGTIIITVGVGAGATALESDQKASMAMVDEVKNETAESKKNKKEEKEDSGEAELLSKYQTENTEGAEKEINLQIACSKLNGYELKPGETFSFIEVAGPFTDTEGYVNAPVIVSDNQMGEGIGGGVCQVSTTLYNAALSGDLEIVERKRHSFPMNYAPVGLDAAISTPEVDLKLKNNFDSSVYIFASVENGKVVVQLFGKPQDKKIEIRIQSVVKKEMPPEGSEIRFSETLAPGEKQVIQEERTGYEVSVYREYYQDNELIDKQAISEDTYPTVQGIILEGSSNTNK